LIDAEEELQTIFNFQIALELLRAIEPNIDEPKVWSIFNKCGGNPFNAPILYKLLEMDKMKMTEITEKQTKKKVFLGGTCNESTWRDTLKPMLEIEYFDPVVPDWTEEAYQQELKEREKCDYCLYVITPKMTGVYSIAEAIADSIKRPSKTIFAFMDKDGDTEFDKAQQKSLNKVAAMINQNGGVAIETAIQDLQSIAGILNKA
jgi:hypothetical protein